jgi:protein associated with RNAse G/E
MNIGDAVRVRAFKADGTCYRTWLTMLDVLRDGLVVTFSPPGNWVDDIRGGWISKSAIRAYYWPDKLYSLLEVLSSGEILEEIYVNIQSPIVMIDSEITFTDYELDISRVIAGEAVVVDEDEFLEAVKRYGYPVELQTACFLAAAEALEVANNWIAKGVSGR